MREYLKMKNQKRREYMLLDKQLRLNKKKTCNKKPIKIIGCWEEM